jgi:hypothetical protein
MRRFCNRIAGFRNYTVLIIQLFTVVGGEIHVFKPFVNFVTYSMALVSMSNKHVLQCVGGLCGNVNCIYNDEYE